MEMREKKHKNWLSKVFFAALITACALLLLGVGASAAPALREEQQFTQPNGVEFRGTLRGDEYLHFLEAQDGSILAQGDDGYWYYAEERNFVVDGEAAAELAPSQAKYLIGQAPSQANQLTKEQLRGAPFQYRRGGKMAAPRAARDDLGEQSLLVILVDFNNATIQYESQWAAQVFGDSGKTVKTFYAQATGGMVNIVPARETSGAQNDGVVRVKLSRNHPNVDISTMADFRNIIAAASSYVDFASYDINNNGVIDRDELHIVLVYAGYEAAYSGDTPSVWAHNWTRDISVPAIGKTFVNYSCLGERQGNHMATIGVVCHELGHGLGLPDLYTNDYSSDETSLTGISVMGGGWEYLSGEYHGATPVLLDAYCLERLGAVTPEEAHVGQTLTAQVRSWSTNGKNTLRVPSGVPNEYFLIECRSKEGFDAALNGVGGVAVYRVNTYNANNLTAGKFLVDWLCLDPYDGPYEEWYTGSLFYSTRPSGRTYINAYTWPSNRLSGRYGYSWFRFDCLSGSGPYMDITIQPDQPGGTYAVTFDAAGGSGGPAAQYKKQGDSLVLSGAAPARAGHAFLGWAISDTATTASYQPGATYAPDADITLYALWRANTYTISYNANGGMGVLTSQTKTHGIDLVLSAAVPTRTGYNFLGWATDSTAAAAQFQPGGVFTIEATTRLYAVWAVRTYTVSYNANGGGGAPANQTKSHDIALTLDGARPTRGGYNFQGWATSAGSSTAQYQPGGSYTSNADVTLYAVWTAEKGIFGTNAKWNGAWWHYLLFFVGFGFIWMWF